MVLLIIMRTRLVMTAYSMFRIYYAGLDARGFLFGPSVAMKIGAAFVPVRKEGKLPGETLKLQSEKEYGKVSLTQVPVL